MERALARVKLTLPDAWQFDTTVTVRIGDINYGGHLGNDGASAKTEQREHDDVAR